MDNMKDSKSPSHIHNKVTIEALLDYTTQSIETFKSLTISPEEDDIIGNKLNLLLRTGKLAKDDITDELYEDLYDFPINISHTVLEEFEEISKTKKIENKPLFIYEQLVAKLLQLKISKTEIIPEEKLGPNHLLMKSILKRTGFPLSFSAGLRVYGPPPNWEGNIPSFGCEVFCKNIPKYIFEDELILIFEKYGDIYTVKLLMDAESDQHRGCAFITYANATQAESAEKNVNQSEIRPNVRLDVQIVKPDQYQLLIKNIPPEKNKYTILKNVLKGVGTEELLNAIIYSSPKDRRKNLGFLILKYSSFDSVSRAMEELKQRTKNLTMSVELLQYNDISLLMNNIHICKPSSEFIICDCIKKKLNEIKTIAQRVHKLERLAKKKPDGNVKLAKYKTTLMENYAYHSLAIETENTSDKNIADLVEATQYALRLNREITDQDLLDVQNFIELDEDHGFRETDVCAVSSVYGVWAATTNKSDLNSMLPIFIEFVNRQCKEDGYSIRRSEYEVIRAAMVSLMLILIHPMKDGNGRLSRIFFNLVLRKCECDYPMITFPYPEKNLYFESIVMAQKAGDLSLYFRFICRCVIISLMTYEDLLKKYD